MSQSAAGAVVTAFLEGEAVPAAEGGCLPDVFEVTVRAEPPAVKAGPAPEIDGEVRHPAVTSVLLCIERCTEGINPIRILV